MITDSRLSQVADGERILSVEAGTVAAPAHAIHPGNHLLVNCVYHGNVNRSSPESRLAAARADTLAVLRILTSNKMLEGIASVCISFYVRDPAHPRRRLYRCSIFTSAISSDETPIDAAFLLPAKMSIQSSEIEEINNLLRAESK
jgi:hypothetical protein